MRSRWTAAAIVVAALLPLCVQTVLVARVGFGMGDFRAFYCAARVASHGANPYHTEPLHACELAVSPRELLQKRFDVTVPAPLPGYAIAAFVPLSMLPFGFAQGLWFASLLASWGVCVAALVRFAGVSWRIGLAAFSLALGLASIPLGEIVPVAVAAICVSGYYAWQRNWRLAAVAATVAMLEPHLGLPACVALAVWQPPTRPAFAIGFTLLAALSLLALGPAGNLEYFASVLPAHALSEASRNTQFSLTSVLTSLGFAEGTAARLGTLWYAAMLLVGTIVAGRLARRTENAAFLACAPPAFAVFGGAFVHVTQIAAALPATLLFLGYARRERRAAAVVALGLLAVPWIAGWSPILGIAPAFPIAYLVWCYSGGNVRTTLTAAIATAALLVALNYSFNAPARQPAHRSLPAIGNSLAESSWSRFSHENSTTLLGLTRIPTWAGLGLILVALCGGASSVTVRQTRFPAYAVTEVS